MKAKIGRQWDSKPAPGCDPGDDWTVIGGVLELVPCAQAVVAAYLAEPDEEMVERVARAMVDHRFSKGFSRMLWDDLPGYYRAELLAEAVAAIKAMPPDGG